MQPELELVMMGEDEDSRKHFSLKAILDQEKPKKRKGKKRKEKEEVREQECNEVGKLCTMPVAHAVVCLVPGLYVTSGEGAGQFPD